MDILRINTPPKIEIVAREKLNIDLVYSFELVSEFNKTKQNIIATFQALPNENYSATFATFPEGKAREKFSYTILQEEKVLSLGKLIIVSENESIQDYTTTSTNKYYS